MKFSGCVAQWKLAWQMSEVSGYFTATLLSQECYYGNPDAQIGERDSQKDLLDDNDVDCSFFSPIILQSEGKNPSISKEDIWFKKTNIKDIFHYQQISLAIDP